MKFLSKRDWWISILMWGSAIYLIVAAFSCELEVIIRIVLFLLSALILWIYNSTYYQLADDFIMIRCGPLKVKVAYEDIEYIKPTKNIISSLALSIDKLKIKTRNKGLNVIYISPQNKEEFIKELCEKYSDIKIVN